MANNDSASYNLRWNTVVQDLEYASSLGWLATGVTAGGGINQLTGDVTAGPGTGSQAASIAATTVTGKLLTGYSSGAGTVAATDTILQGINKLNGNTAAKTNTTIHADSNTNLTGDVQLISGSNVTLTQSGQGITIAASGGGSTPNISIVTSTAATTASSGSPVSTPFSAPITPTTNTSVIKISLSSFMETANRGVDGVHGFVYRDGTQLGQFYFLLGSAAGFAGVDDLITFSCFVTDIPGDTSSHTYLVKLSNEGGPTTVTLGVAGSLSTFIVEEISH